MSPVYWEFAATDNGNIKVAETDVNQNLRDMN